MIKIVIGWITFVLSLIFALSLLCTMILTTFFQMDGPRGLKGFFGFGLPMILTACAALGLWPKEKYYNKILGFVSALFGAAYGVCVLLIVGLWVFATSATSSPRPGIWHFIGMFVLMVVCGGFAVDVLRGAAKPD